MNDSFKTWLVGFAEGEGSFNIGFKGKLIFQIHPSFKIALSEKDKELIYKIRSELGFGNISYVSSEAFKKAGIKNPQTQYVYQCQNIFDCLKLIEVLDENLFLSSKKEDYIIWKNAVFMIRDQKHLEKEGFLELARMRDKLHSLRTFGKDKGRYKDFNFFKEYIDKHEYLFSPDRLRKRKETAQTMLNTTEKKRLTQEYNPTPGAKRTHCIKCNAEIENPHHRKVLCRRCYQEQKRKYKTEYMKKYQKTPKGKAILKRYLEKPEVKAKQKESMKRYKSKPEVMAKIRERNKEYMRKLYKTPKYREYSRTYYQKRKERENNRKEGLT